MNGKNFFKLSVDVPVCRHACDGIPVRQKDYFHKYLYVDLLWVKASGCYCDLHFRDESRLTVAFPLSVVAGKLPADLFVRIEPFFKWMVSIHNAPQKFYV